MTPTIVEQLAAFTVRSRYETLPAAVVAESKRLFLDSVGCALAGLDDPKGRAGIEYGRAMGGTDGNATIMGTGDRVSIFGAAFANGELINALDFDALLPPGHVTPYVLPGVLAVAEAAGASGKALINAIALSHEMSYRIGKAMDYLRDIKDGKVCPPPVYGYSSTVFGATAAIAKVKGFSREVVANALGVAGGISPVNAHRAWSQHTPSNTTKYLVAGVLAQTALTAAHLAEYGHRGDTQILDDAEYGFPRFIGTSRWVPEGITRDIGSEWLFPTETSYKPYPHCRILHALLGCMTDVLEKNDIKPHEIDGIKAWVEGFVMQPIWLNRDIGHVVDAQFSVAHGLAVGAHRLPPGKAWQDPKFVYSRSVLDLMPKVTYEVHPNYAELLAAGRGSQPAHIEIKARGQTFVAERLYPKGTPSPDPESYMTTDELVAKFRRNAEGVISDAKLSGVIDALLNLERVDDIGAVMRQISGASTTKARAQAA